MRKSFLFIFALLLIFNTVFFFGAFAVLAQTGGNNPPGPPSGTGGDNPPPGGGGGGFTLENPIDSEDFAAIVKKIAELIVKIALPILVVMIIWAGAQFVFAQGNETKLSAAKKTLWYSLIGALLVVGAFAIATAVDNFAKKL